jgi:ribonuclease HI
MTAQGTPVLNRDLIEALDARTRELGATYGWVRGHNGHAVNEIVDGLAQGAARGAGSPDRPAVISALRSIGLLR